MGLRSRLEIEGLAPQGAGAAPNDLEIEGMKKVDPLLPGLDRRPPGPCAKGEKCHVSQCGVEFRERVATSASSR
jgi:hypothetical protein